MALPDDWTPNRYVRNVVTPDGVVQGEVSVSFYDDCEPIISASVWDRRGMADGETFVSAPWRHHPTLPIWDSVEAALAGCDAKLAEVVSMAPSSSGEQLEANRPAEVHRESF